MKKILKRYNQPGKWEIVIPFDEQGMELEWTGIVDARLPGEYNLTVVAEHSVAKTRGRVTVKAVCGEGSTVSLKGIIRIAKEAQETDDFLELRVLNLGPKSRATVEPELEIEANNVRASHAASVGVVDPEQLRYLMSRGLSLKQACDEVVNGFMSKFYDC